MRENNVFLKSTSMRERKKERKKERKGGAAVAQWICSRLPSCHPRFESQAHHLRFFQFKFEFKRGDETTT